MAKFTVYFKDKVKQSHIFDSGIVRIGRDDTNDIIIDSLAIAPAHAVIIIKESGCIIKQLNNEFPLTINNESSKATLLQNNDVISLAKHTIVFNSTESVNNIPIKNTRKKDNDVEFLNRKLQDKLNSLNGNLQVMDGPHIGRILSLKKPITRFGQSNSDVVLVSKRKDGYYISTQKGISKILINQQPLTDKSMILKNNDIIVIDNLSMQFFLDN